MIWLSRKALFDKLEPLASIRPQRLKFRESIKDLLLLLGLDPSEGFRELLADELNVHVGPTTSSNQNTALYEEMIEQLCKNGGELPETIHKLHKQYKARTEASG